MRGDVRSLLGYLPKSEYYVESIGGIHTNQNDIQSVSVY